MSFKLRLVVICKTLWYNYEKYLNFKKEIFTNKDIVLCYAESVTKYSP